MASLETGSIAALNGVVLSSGLDNFGTAGIIVTGTWVGTLTIQGSLDGTNFITMFWQSLSTNAIKATSTTNDQFLVNVAGLKALQVKMTSYTSGTASITIQANAAVVLQRSMATLFGATDGTQIGNISDRLKVEASVSTSATTTSTIVKLAYDDMNASTGGVARGTSITTSYTTIYNRSGTGYIFGYSVSFEGNIIGADEFILKFTVDGLTVAEISTADIGTNALYAAGSDGDAQIWGFQTANNNLMFKTPGHAGLRYSSSVQIQIKKASGSNKQFRAGVIALTKE